MTMTPEERAVVQAAATWRASEMAGHGIIAEREALSVLASAVNELFFNCPQCNSGGHTCPGDGEPIGHGDTDCGKHDDVPGWVPRTWLDVRTGDRVRLNEQTPPAYVQSAMHLHWQTDPRTGTSQYNPPQPLAWSAVRVTLDLSETRAPGQPLADFDMDPAKPVDIELSESEVAAIEAIGWEHRIGLVVTAEPKPAA